MHLSCPYCELKSDYISDCRTIVGFGRFHRTSDSRDLKRYRCLLCKRTFSDATKDKYFRQKKRQKNGQIFEQLASGTSQRRTARLLRINRKTVAKRLVLLGLICRNTLEFDRAGREITELEFDDIETFEHSKSKPVSIILAVEAKTRRILGFEVAQMPAKGRLAEKSVKKYGLRRDERRAARRRLFQELRPIVAPGAIIRSDSNPHYVEDVKEFFPDCHHVRVLGARGASTGQGELKKVAFDPIFSFNHTAAMLRANVARLIRKTWCTTKKKERLADHLAIYAVYHNQHLKKS